MWGMEESVLTVVCSHVCVSTGRVLTLIARLIKSSTFHLDIGLLFACLLIKYQLLLTSSIFPLLFHCTQPCDSALHCQVLGC
jgi:hypothetical protein